MIQFDGEFAKLPRSGDTVYGFAAGLYPTDYPTLPATDDESVDRSIDAAAPGRTQRLRRSGEDVTDALGREELGR